MNAVPGTVTGIAFCSPWGVMKAFVYHHYIVDSVICGFDELFRCVRFCVVRNFGPKGIRSDLLNLYKSFYFFLAELLWSHNRL